MKEIYAQSQNEDESYINELGIEQIIKNDCRFKGTCLVLVPKNCNKKESEI